MKTWFVSDTHFGHANIIRYSGRPFTDLTEMDENLIANWNARVAPDDVVWHLGDFAFCKRRGDMTGRDVLAQYRKQLNGVIHLIRGNHDHRYSVSAYIESGFRSVQDYSKFAGALLVHRPTDPIIARLKPHVVVHGHCHELPSPLSNGVNISVEHTAYAPIDGDALRGMILGETLEEIRKRREET